MNRKMLVLGLGLLMLGAVVSLACSSANDTTPQGTDGEDSVGSYRSVTSAQVDVMIEDRDFVLVNVHIPHDGDIPGTDLLVPYDEIEQNLSEFPESKEAKIVLYCRSGPMSDTAAEALVNLGFTNVWTLDGGFLEWEKQGYEFIRTTPSAAQPKIHFYEDFVDLGMVPHGEPVDYTFTFKNMGDAPLIVEGASAKALEGC